MALTTAALLSFSPAPDGSPWGTGTHMAKRRAAGVDPWVTGCDVTTLIGGYAAMTMMVEHARVAHRGRRRQRAAAGSAATSTSPTGGSTGSAT